MTTQYYIYRTLICPAALAPTLQAMMVQLAGPAGEGMFVVGLSPTGTAPATHYISTGAIGIEFELPLSSPEAMHATCEAAGVAVTLEQCQAILSACVIVDLEIETAQETLDRLGLKLVQEVLE